MKKPTTTHRHRQLERLYLILPRSYQGRGHIEWLRSKGMRWDRTAKRWYILRRNRDYRVLQFVDPTQLASRQGVTAPTVSTGQGVSRVNS